MTMTSRSFGITVKCFLLTAVFATAVAASAQSSRKASSSKPLQPWMNPALSADERADLVVKEMTLDEKISLLHGTGMKGLSPMSPLAVDSNGGGGGGVGGTEHRIPPFQITDRPYRGRRAGRNRP